MAKSVCYVGVSVRSHNSEIFTSRQSCLQPKTTLPCSKPSSGLLSMEFCPCRKRQVSGGAEGKCILISPGPCPLNFRPTQHISQACGRTCPAPSSSGKGCSPSLAHQPQGRPLWVAAVLAVPCPSGVWAQGAQCQHCCTELCQGPSSSGHPEQLLFVLEAFPS